MEKYNLIEESGKMKFFIPIKQSKQDKKRKRPSPIDLPDKKYFLPKIICKQIYREWDD